MLDPPPPPPPPPLGVTPDVVQHELRTHVHTGGHAFCV